ncbi:MAG TPA: hypothetical protein VFZ98_05700, partial [Vicinamibacterales bacterium]
MWTPNATGTTTSAIAAATTTTPTRATPLTSPDTRRESRTAWLLVATIAWAVLAVGGVYPWAAAPLIVAAALAAVLAPAAPLTPPDTRTLDWLLIASVAAATFQLLPLPSALRAVLSPHADTIPAALQLVPIERTTWRPLSAAPASTAYAIGLVLTVLIFFWAARQCCARGQAGRIVHGIALTGLFVALVAMVLQASGPHSLIYGRWHALDKDAHPFGPFVNRDHFATW